MMRMTYIFLAGLSGPSQTSFEMVDGPRNLFDCPTARSAGKTDIVRSRPCQVIRTQSGLGRSCCWSLPLQPRLVILSRNHCLHLPVFFSRLHKTLLLTGHACNYQLSNSPSVIATLPLVSTRARTGCCLACPTSLLVARATHTRISLECDDQRHQGK